MECAKTALDGLTQRIRLRLAHERKEAIDALRPDGVQERQDLFVLDAERLNRPSGRGDNRRSVAGRRRRSLTRQWRRLGFGGGAHPGPDTELARGQKANHGAMERRSRGTKAIHASFLPNPLSDNGARGGDRTRDQRLMSPLLYH